MEMPNYEMIAECLHDYANLLGDGEIDGAGRYLPDNIDEQADLIAALSTAPVAMKVDSQWHVACGQHIALIYSLMQDGWRKGEPVMIDDVMIRVEKSHKSQAEIQPIVEAIMSALSAAPVSEPEPVAKELWALCYLNDWDPLHDWDPPKDGQEHKWEPGKNVFPAVHAFYPDWREAEAIRKDMNQPEKYWVVRARSEYKARLDKAMEQHSPSSAERMREAAKAVVAAEASWRECMPKDWEGDPLTDAIAELRAALAEKGGAA